MRPRRSSFDGTSGRRSKTSSATKVSSQLKNVITVEIDSGSSIHLSKSFEFTPVERNADTSGFHTIPTKEVTNSKVDGCSKVVEAKLDVDRGQPTGADAHSEMGRNKTLVAKYSYVAQPVDGALEVTNQCE
ncbi:hypothetical protein HDU67_007602, partial [Dinochytrium kinnereticum]